MCHYHKKALYCHVSLPQESIVLSCVTTTRTYCTVMCHYHKKALYYHVSLPQESIVLSCVTTTRKHCKLNTKEKPFNPNVFNLILGFSITVQCTYIIARLP
ncbi:unnamed protein product [Owenia fusiformis]|uniref:Uncharacterized protein n=1 Tax=Owenia fusiformis TaxID=6347 RepID=A0A8J1TIF6_OWEFU|nr:unnamed protein product [Owenia fusiformis]